MANTTNQAKTIALPSVLDGVDQTNPSNQTSDQFLKSVDNLNNQTLTPISSFSDVLTDSAVTLSSADTTVANNITAFKSNAIDQINSVIGSLTDGLLSASDLNDVITVQDGLNIDTNQLLNKVSNNLGYDVTTIPGFQDQFGQQSLNEFQRLTQMSIGDLVYADGNSLKIRGDWRSGIGDSLLGYLAQSSDTFKALTDLVSSNSILNTLVNNCSQLGIKDGFKALFGQYKRPEDAQNALINNVYYLVAKGDIDSLNEILTLINDDGVNTINAQYPLLVNMLLTNFSFGYDVTPNDYPKLKQDLLLIITKIKGSDWYLMQTQFGLIPNLALVSSISDDSRTLLMDEDYLIPLLGASNKFRSQDSRNVFIQDFPGVPTLS